MSNVSLKVTPGITFSPTGQPVGSAELNRAAKPLVELEPTGAITPDFLDLSALETELGDALRGVNYLAHPGFWTQDWDKVDGVSAKADEWTENALDWFLKPTGAAIAYNRIMDGPNTANLYAVQLVGATGCTSADFCVWVPSCIAAQLRSQQLSFSIYAKNMTTDPFYVTPILLTGDAEDNKTTITLAQTGTNTSLAEGEWQRVVFTILASDYAAFKNGFYIGLRTANLTGALKSVHFTQAQLEVGAVATSYKKPMLPSTPRSKVTLPVEFAGNDKLTGGWLAMFLKASNTMRYLGAPPMGLIDPYLGWNRKGGYPEWKDNGNAVQVFTYTGRDQDFTIPAGINKMKVECWGAGGSSDYPGSNVVLSGGVGAYAWGEFTVSEGDDFSVVVGRGEHGLLGRAYGFGGAGQGTAHQHNGGGLSGVFTGTGTVIASQDSRALVIAGGGGAGGQSGNGVNGVQGGNGGDPSRSGGMSDFQGADSTGGVSSGGGGGGGGRRGGESLGLGGKGGTSYLDASKTAGALAYAAYPSLNVPGSTKDNYDSPAGRPGESGLVVVTFSYVAP